MPTTSRAGNDIKRYATMPMSPDIQEALIRHLETDQLLGIRSVPMSLTSAQLTGGQTARSAATDTAQARQVDPGKPAHMPTASTSHVQKVPDAEKDRRQKLLDEMNRKHVSGCQKCTLAESRTQTVFGQGHPAARIVFVGEAPGAEEDKQGLAFVGRAGQLLTKMIEAMGLSRDEVFICNVLKCRPPNNRDPAPNEVESCWPYLDQQLQIIQPEVIIALGKPAAQTLLRTKEGISKLRGRWHDYYVSGTPMVGEPTPLMPTYHPAYLLRNPAEKVKVWKDLKEVLAKLGLPVPKH
jgi:DNA polymerase